MNDNQPASRSRETSPESNPGVSRRAVVRRIVAGAPAVLVLTGRSAYAGGRRGYGYGGWNGKKGRRGNKNGSDGGWHW